jgi:replicative DNA helicase
MPQNIELEKTVLGKLLNLEKFEIQVKYISEMTESFFSTFQTIQVFKAIASCVDQNTLAYPHYLIERKLVDDDSLTDIMTYKFESNQKMKYKINELKLLAYRREVIESAHKFIDDMHKGEDIVAKSEKFLLETTNALSYGKKRKRKTSKDMIKSSYQNITTGKTYENLISYGVDFLDSRIYHERGQTHIIGAKPGVGKTAIGLTVVKNAVLKGRRCVFFVKESTKEEIFERMIAQEANVSYSDFKFNWSGLTPNIQQRIINMYKKFSEIWDRIHFFGCDDYKHTASEIDEILTSVTEEHGQIDIVVTDYVQNMNPPRWMRSSPRHEIISHNIEKLSSIHKEHKVAGIVLAQLNRDTNGKPHIDNLKGSSMLEQEAHIITFLHRDRNMEPVENKLPTEIYCEKQRLGSEFSGVTIGLKIPSIEFVEMSGYTKSDQPPKLQQPKI